MTDEIRNRYESALETLRGIVARTGDNRDRIQALIRDAAFAMAEALEKTPTQTLTRLSASFAER